MLLVILIWLIIFLLGAVWGSFINVVSLRLNSGRTLAGRSACPHCQKKLSWYELVPVFSFLSQKGRCRNCKSKISSQYLLAEIGMGVLFLVGFLVFANTPLDLFIYFVFISLGFILSLYDYRHQILPDKILLPLIVLSFLIMIISRNPSFIEPSFYLGFLDFYLIWPGWFRILSGPIIASPFFLIWLLSKGESFGMGDIKLLLAIGWQLGFLLGIIATIIAFWSGMIFVVLLVLNNFLQYKKLKNWNELRKTAIPFGPFLLFGWLIAYLFSGNFINLYLLNVVI